MKRSLAPRGLAAILLLALVGCAGGSASTPTPAPTPTPTPLPPRVVVISVDGLRPDAIGAADTPSMRSLINKGSHTLSARTIDLSNTLPSHTSMLCGYPLEMHGIFWDDYQPARKLTVPTLFTATRRQALRSVMVVGKEKFVHFRDAGDVDTFSLIGLGDDAVANEAIVQLGTGPDLLFVHFPDVDLTGHEHGWMSTAYLARVATVDRAIGRLLAALPTGSTVILTADHGGSGHGHGTTSAQHVTIPWVIAGPGIRQGVTLTSPVTTVDTAATIARILRISLPGDIRGLPVTSAFQ